MSKTSPTSERGRFLDTRYFLTDAQFKYEVAKCENCEEKPCREACPAGVSPMDFILAAKVGLPSDFRRAAARILTANPLGGICGITCPDTLCMAACVYKDMNRPVDIPACQAYVVAKAKELDVMPSYGDVKPNGKKVAVMGAGPAGLAAAAVLGRLGYAVTIFEREAEAGGMCLLIPGARLPRDVVASDVEHLLAWGNITLNTGAPAPHPLDLLEHGFDAVAVCAGLDTPLGLGVDGEDLAVSGLSYLWSPEAYPMTGVVAVVGGGASALDCATTAVERGASRVSLIALENLKEMPLTTDERHALLDYKIEISGRTRVTGILREGDKITGLRTINVTLAPGKEFSLDAISDIPGTDCTRCEFRHVIISIGARSSAERVEHPAVVFAGDLANGPTTVVEAVASGKNAAQRIDSYLTKTEVPEVEDPVRSAYILQGYASRPVALTTDFFGRQISSPFLLSAAPPTDGLDQMKAAYQAGWPGGIMKTAFDGVPIHIPAAYMHLFDSDTYGNCDNVSGHALDRVCAEVEALVKLYPDRLTMASTGGSVTGDDEADRKSWQGNTRKLEAAGAMGVEYSLSCPQGGDGTEGDIVSQNAALTAKIIDWIMEVSDAEVPKLFKLTGAVTSIFPIMTAIREVLDKYPAKRAGVTLANSFPTMTLRPGTKATWEEGIVVGMSGDGVTPISYLTLAKAAGAGVAISGNGGPMDYKAAADFLALGATTVQFCTLVMKYGYSIIDHIEEGVSQLMLDRGIGSMAELIGRALPDAITDFMDLSPEKAISAVYEDLCLKCGNCTRCPYLAIKLDEDKHPVTDAAKCIGCGICTLKCFSGALYLRERTEEERAALSEA
jgi:NADPH-dependent glutamate synthase beta subunit-like oxidoreductase/dihydroorotate dehydrogenase/ferredoxin